MMDDDPPDPLPPADPDRIDDDALPTFDMRAFLWTLGACVGVPLLGLLVKSVVVFLMAGVLWLVTLILGIGALISGQRAFGSAILLGVIAGALVGFTLCSGFIGIF